MRVQGFGGMVLDVLVVVAIVHPVREERYFGRLTGPLTAAWGSATLAHDRFVPARSADFT